MEFHIKQLLPIVLSVALLGACAGVPKAQQPKAEPLSRQAVQVKSQKKAPPNSLAYYHFLLSQSKLEEGKIDEAMEDLKRAIAYDEKEPSLHVELATLYIHKGLLNEAIEECKVALTHDPNDLSAQLLLGGIYSSLKKNPLASGKLSLPQLPLCRGTGIRPGHPNSSTIPQNRIRLRDGSLLPWKNLCRDEIL
jgi:tetratricopeptide (TPR) repeat protein